MAVLDQSDVPGQGLAADLGQELAFVQPVQEAFQHASGHGRAGFGMFPMEAILAWRKFFPNPDFPRKVPLEFRLAGLSPSHPLTAS